MSEKTKYFLYELKLHIFRFLFIGLCGLLTEIIYTNIIAFAKEIIKCSFTLCTLGITGHTSIFNIFLYGCVSFAFYFLTPIFEKYLSKNIFLRSIRYIVYGLIFILWELIGGLFLRYVIGMPPNCMWNYSNLPLNILGLTTFVMYPAWIIAAIVGEGIHNRLLQIDDIIVNPKGYSKQKSMRQFVKKSR